MSILDVQRRFAELGRIRSGTKNDKGYPVKLDTWRLTSPQRHLIAAAADLYGGTVQPWTAPAGDQWEVITTTAELPCVVPPQRIDDGQLFELWGRLDPTNKQSPVECLRRCDGRTQTDGTPCVCDPQDRECAPRTHLLVMLPDLPGFGVWRVTTTGFNAAAELPATVDLLAGFAAAGAPVEAILRIDKRVSRRGGETHRFVVPVIDIPGTAADLVARLPNGVGVGVLTTGGGAVPGTVRSGGGIGDGSPPSLPPTPAASPVEVSPVAALVRGSASGGGDVAEPQPVDDLAVLRDHLAVLPADSDTMPMWEAYVRTLCDLMEAAGRWPQDSIHAALAKQGAEHVADLKKAQLLVFTKRAHARAVEQLGGNK